MRLMNYLVYNSYVLFRVGLYIIQIFYLGNWKAERLNLLCFFPESGCHRDNLSSPLWTNLRSKWRQLFFQTSLEVITTAFQQQVNLQLKFPRAPILQRKFLGRSTTEVSSLIKIHGSHTALTPRPSMSHFESRPWSYVRCAPSIGIVHQYATLSLRTLPAPLVKASLSLSALMETSERHLAGLNGIAWSE